jgi:ribonuclease J
VIASCFSSHVHRMQQLFDIAEETGRKVCLLGRSMNKNSNIARNLGYMNADHVELVKPGEIEELPDREVLVLCTGSQGEPLAALSRIASGRHPNIRARAEDTFIFSSRTIPGNEVRVHSMMNELSRVGSHVYHGAVSPVHVSGHACAEELKTLLQLVRPQNFLPVHGEWRHLRAHAELAQSVGVDPSRITIGENGCVVELANGVARKTEEVVPHGQVLVDRDTREEVLEDIMEDRQQLSGDGLVVVVARPDDPGSRIDVVSRGFADDDEVLERGRLAAEELLDDIEANGFELPEGLSHGQAREMDEAELLEDAIETVVADAIRKATRRSPLVVPLVLR